jgi:hypothetical protein
MYKQKILYLCYLFYRDLPNYAQDAYKIRHINGKLYAVVPGEWNKYYEAPQEHPPYMHHEDHKYGKNCCLFYEY